ncbi:unnamed protein product [Clavelina lepadiformis]|uniref:Protein CMSS1 n=1 Tax=Clavelina lepadiformis TaxID=159417 RepID=A0ABP0FGS0_CLALP
MKSTGNSYKRKEVSGDDNEDDETTAVKKKKRKRKRITEEEIPTSGGDCSSLRNALNKHFPDLSTLEVEDMALDDCHFTTCNVEKTHTVISYLKQTLPKWHRISTDHNHKMSPLILVICGNALRASNLNSSSKPFKGKSCRSAKLFSRHMKIEEQAKTLKNSVIHFAVGTPARIKALIQQGALTLAHTRAVVIDWNWRDVKMKRIADVRETRESLFSLLKDCVIPACKTGNVKIGLF